MLWGKSLSFINIYMYKRINIDILSEINACESLSFTTSLTNDRAFEDLNKFMQLPMQYHKNCMQQYNSFAVQISNICKKNCATIIVQ